MQDSGQLYTLYINYKKDPKKYEQELADTLNKLVYKVLHQYGTLGSNRLYEDQADVVQDLLLFSYKLWHKIKDPSNKRIYNYMYYSILRYLGKRKQKTVIGNKRELTYLSNTYAQPKMYVADTSNLMDFGCESYNTIAKLLIEGYNQKEIIAMDFTAKEVKKAIKHIKNTILNK